MIEELQRSVIFFSRANGTLKQRNEELERMLFNANAQIRAFESGKNQAQKEEEEAPNPGRERCAPPVRLGLLTKFGALSLG